MKQDELNKIWKWSHTKYSLASSKTWTISHVFTGLWEINYELRDLLDQIFLKFTPRWTELSGFDWFVQWCNSRNLDPVKKITTYASIHNHIELLRNECGLLDATLAFRQHVEHMTLDQVLYADQYKWIDFERGKLAVLTFYARQSQNRRLLLRCIKLFLDHLTCYIQIHDIDALAFVPRSITRDRQLLKLIDTALFEIDLPRISIKKDYEWEIKVPQKSLKKRIDRIENARETIYIRDSQVEKHNTVLLIDDFVWSGSTLNETAKKLKKEWVKTVIGFAIVGNLDLSYEVINEV